MNADYGLQCDQYIILAALELQIRPWFWLLWDHSTLNDYHQRLVSYIP